MKEIRLMDGSLMEIKVNFLTLKLMVDVKLERLNQLYEEKRKKGKDDQILQMKIASKMIYVILRSNGKKVDEEEACMLVPVDVDEIMILFDEFVRQMEKVKKKQESKMKHMKA